MLEPAQGSDVKISILFHIGGSRSWECSSPGVGQSSVALTSFVGVQILLPFGFETLPTEKQPCAGSSVPNPPCSHHSLKGAESLKSLELFVPNAGSWSPPRAARLCSTPGTGLGAEALLLVGQLSPGLVPPLPLPAHDHCNRRRGCFSRSCCLDPWCSGRLRADPGAVESPSSPQSLVSLAALDPAWLRWEPSLGAVPKPISIETAEFGCCLPKNTSVFFLCC